MKYRLINGVFLLLMPLAANAQAVPITVSQFRFDMNFITPLLLGTLMALAASLLLLRIGMATGSSVLMSKMKDFFSRDDNSSKNSKNNDNLTKTHLYERAKSIGNGIKNSVHMMGLGTCLMVALSLFFGSFMAAGMIVPQTVFFTFAIAFSIWALFTLTVNYVQARVVRDTLAPAGNSIRMVSGGTYDSVSKIASTTDSKRIRNLCRNIVKDVKKELKGEYTDSELHRQLDTLIHRIEDKEDSRRLLTNLAEILNHTEIKWLHQESGEEKVLLHTDFSEVRFSSPKSKKAASLSKRAAHKLSEGDDMASKVAGVLNVVTPGTEETTGKMMSKIGEILEDTGNEDLSSERLKQDFEEILAHPDHAKQIFKEKMDSNSRSDLLQSVASATGISSETLESNFNRIQDFFESYSGSDSQSSSKANMDQRGTYNQTQQSSELVSEFTEKISNNNYGSLAMNQKSGEADSSHSDFIEQDMESLFDNPEDFRSIAKNRWENLSEDDFRALLRNRTSLSDQKIEANVMRLKRYKAKSSAVMTRARVMLKDSKIAAQQLTSDIGEAATYMLWWRAAAPVVGAAAAFGGAAAAMV